MGPYPTVFLAILHPNYSRLYSNSTKSKISSYSTDLAIPHHLWNLMIYCHVHRSLALDPTLNHINLVHILKYNLFEINSDIRALRRIFGPKIKQNLVKLQ